MEHFHNTQRLSAIDPQARLAPCLPPPCPSHTFIPHSRSIGCMCAASKGHPSDCRTSQQSREEFGGIEGGLEGTISKQLGGLRAITAGSGPRWAPWLPDTPAAASSCLPPRIASQNTPSCCRIEGKPRRCRTGNSTVAAAGRDTRHPPTLHRQPVAGWLESFDMEEACCLTIYP